MTVAVKLPKTIKVGYRDFNVSQAPLRDRYGECDKDRGQILYAPGQSNLQLLNTILHEIDHACWDLGGLEDKEPEERVVTVLNNVRTGVLRDNRELVSWINYILKTNS